VVKQVCWSRINAESVNPTVGSRRFYIYSFSQVVCPALKMTLLTRLHDILLTMMAQRNPVARYEKHP
jgi:hypothetical protein